MADIYAENHAGEAERVTSDVAAGNGTLSATILGALLIVGLPTVFWMSLIELANYVLSLGITMTTRLIVAGVLVALLSLIWGFIVCSGQKGACS